MRLDKRRRYQTRKGPNSSRSVGAEDDASILGSIRLYKRAARSSQENGPLLPTASARLKSLSAIEEVAAGLSERFSSDSPGLATLDDVFESDGATQDYVSVEEIVAELQHQDSNKACGIDGVHIRLMQTLASTSFVHVLAALYNSCIRYAKTPCAWNDTMVCLIVKDHTRPKDADNVRPITLIGMFRKVLERLLLCRFDAAGWARVQPIQAGFCSHYSTCVNAAVLHALLESRRITHVVFLDFKAAFDVVDHALLLDILRRRGCLPRMQGLIASLTFHHIRSRILSDGEASDWFSRSKGVLQGSPLSPYLFNIFVDGLLEDLNDGATIVPRSLFYADDGTLLASSSSKVQRLLDIVAAWSAQHRMTLNVKKCGYIAPPDDRAQVHLGDEALPRLQEYPYLGFPMTGSGIDFSKHLTRRLDQDCGRATFLSLHSDRWGPAHCLRIYRQYLAPMFEYSAPLVALYAERYSKIWKVAEDAVKKLTGWIAGYTSNSHLTRNILGLQPLPDRSSNSLILSGFKPVIKGLFPNSSVLRGHHYILESRTRYAPRTSHPLTLPEIRPSHLAILYNISRPTTGSMEHNGLASALPSPFFMVPTRTSAKHVTSCSPSVIFSSMHPSRYRMRGPLTIAILAHTPRNTISPSNAPMPVVAPAASGTKKTFHATVALNIRPQGSGTARTRLASTREEDQGFKEGRQLQQTHSDRAWRSGLAVVFHHCQFKSSTAHNDSSDKTITEVYQFAYRPHFLFTVFMPCPVDQVAFAAFSVGIMSESSLSWLKNVL
jgi:hypothetical protein